MISRKLTTVDPEYPFKPVVHPLSQTVLQAQAYVISYNMSHAFEKPHKRNMPLTARN